MVRLNTHAHGPTHAHTSIQMLHIAFRCEDVGVFLSDKEVMSIDDFREYLQLKLKTAVGMACIVMAYIVILVAYIVMAVGYRTTLSHPFANHTNMRTRIHTHAHTHVQMYVYVGTRIHAMDYCGAGLGHRKKGLLRGRAGP